MASRESFVCQGLHRAGVVRGGWLEWECFALIWADKGRAEVREGWIILRNTAIISPFTHIYKRRVHVSNPVES
jgi:hypothetical protein